MIQINLLPAGGKNRGATARPKAATTRGPGLGEEPATTVFAIAIIVVLLGIAFVWWRTGSEKSELDAQIQREATDSLRLASTIQLVESLRARQDTIQQKIGVIRSVDEDRYVWPHLLDEISRSVPAFTWLSSLSATGEAQGDSLSSGPQFTLAGNAGSTQALTRLMKNLEMSPFIKDVTLVTSEQVVEEGRAFQRFTLEAEYQVPDSSVIETVPVVIVE